MWREAPNIQGDKVYRFQTNDPSINLKMKRRKDFKLAAIGITTKIWIYQTEKQSTLRKVTLCKINFETAERIFTANNKNALNIGEQFSLAF
jgi:hypothetical protein